jgi:hypothetical protein
MGEEQCGKGGSGHLDDEVRNDPGHLEDPAPGEGRCDRGIDVQLRQRPEDVGHGHDGRRWTVVFCLKECFGTHRPHFKMLTARATTNKATMSEIASSAIIINFIHGLIAETSVGLNAVAVANAK